MRGAILGMAMGLMAFGAQAETDNELQGVIRSQIDAFLADDFETAFSFASPMIRGMFGSSDRFGQMVQNGYPMVWRPSQIEFQGQRVVGTSIVQRLYVRGPQGNYHYLEYQMVPTAEGWKINGVQVIRAPGVGA